MKTDTPEELAAAWNAVNASSSGQIVMNDLAKRFGFAKRTMFSPGSPDQLAYLEGQRSVIVYINWLMEYTTPEYQKTEIL